MHQLQRPTKADDHVTRWVLLPKSSLFPLSRAPNAVEAAIALKDTNKTLKVCYMSLLQFKNLEILNPYRVGGSTKAKCKLAKEKRSEKQKHKIWKKQNISEDLPIWVKNHD